ncbi:MAG: CoA-binding protein [Candidatus Odinarchaeota archaeon]|nr:CoA-binding protein [Candidatus Odinarchaeota archaeon]
MSEKSILDLFFTPKTVAIIGASNEVNSPGYVTFKNFVDNKKKGKFKGEVFPVNIKGEIILGYKAYKSILDIPSKVDLAVVIVPAKYVPQVMKEIGEKGTKAVAIISAGFSEIGNVELERQVVEIAKSYGIRILGPNGLGTLDPYSGVDTMFLPELKKTLDGKELIGTPRPEPGFMSFLSQSGAFGVAALDYMAGEKIGLRRFVSYGNKVDVDEAELLEYLLHDNLTRAILIYSESIKNGRKFMESAKKVTPYKPVIILKSGRTKAGQRAASSHTAALAGSDAIYEAAFKQSGIIRVENMQHLFDVAKAMVFQRPARGRNIAILTDGGGAGVMASDAAEKSGLNVIPLPKRTYEKFEKLKEEGVFPKFATNVNPIDLTGSVTSEMYEIAADILLADPEIHGMILIALHHPPIVDATVVDRLYRIYKKYDKPVTMCDIGSQEYAKYFREEFDKRGIPAYRTPEQAVSAMEALIRYGEYLKKIGKLDDYLKKWKPPV